MADVSRGDEDRGQLFLVGALSLAVLFVVLALLMNTAIYTENIATRGTGSGTGEAIRYGQAVRAGTAGLVGYVNAHHNSSYGALDANLTAGVDTMSDATSVHYAYEGARADAALVSTVNGTRIAHDNGTRAFTNESGTADWTLASSVDGTRAFRLNVTRGDLAGGASSAFRVNVSNGTHTWRAYVYNDGDTVAVKVENDSEDLSTEQCLAPNEADHTVVDLTRGTVGGEPCPLLDFGRGISGPYSIGFENGDQATGTYGLVVDEPALADDPNDVFFDDASNSPYATPAIYSATVEVRYEGPQITYRTNVTVAPEGGR